MKKRAYIFYVGVLIAGMVVAFFVGKRIASVEPPATETNVKTTKHSADSEYTEGFWLKLENDVIVVYEQNKNDIIAETDIHAEDCSMKDQNMLKNGIYLENIESLFKFLQAHTS